MYPLRINNLLQNCQCVFGPNVLRKCAKSNVCLYSEEELRVFFMLDHVGADLQHIHTYTTKLAGGSSTNDRVSAVVKKMFPTVELHISIWLIPFTDMV